MKLKFIIIFIALIISCDENINDPSSYKQDFLPLTVGSYWIYEFHKPVSYTHLTLPTIYSV